MNERSNQSAAANHRPAGQLDGSDNWTRSRPLARPYGPAAVGSIPFAASQVAQVFATVATERAVSVPNAATIWYPNHIALRAAHRGPAAVAELGSLGGITRIALHHSQNKREH